MLRRNVFTGEIENTADDADQFINRPAAVPAGCVDPRRRCGSAWGRTWRGTSLRVNPAQVDRFNEAARQAKTGAYYEKGTGVMCADSNLARVREYARRGFVDQDGGYSETVDLGSARDLGCVEINTMDELMARTAGTGDRLL